MSSKLPIRSRKSKSHSAKPYERPTNKSLVQKVKSLIPTWLTLPNWLSGSDNDNIVESDEEKEEDHETQVEIGDQESMLREELRDVNTAGPSGIYTQSLGSGDTEYNIPSSSSFTRGPLHRTSIEARNLTSSNIPIVNGDDQSDNSETSASTSGCSSLAPSHQEKKRVCLTGLPITEAALDQIRSELTRKKALLLGERRNLEDSITSSVLIPEKKDVAVSVEFLDNDDNDTPSTQNSLWSEDEHMNYAPLSNRLSSTKRVISSRPQPTGSSKRPCFSTSAFGAPVTANTRQALFDGSLGLSPYYDGRTTFGGASAYRRARVNSHFPYKQNEKTNINVKGKANRECMSSAAKRILNTLERMSTPLQDAKKIPTESTTAELALSFTPGSYRRKPINREHKIHHSQVNRKLPTATLASPSPVNIGRNLQPLFQIDKRKSDSTLDSKEEDFSRTNFAISGKAGGKIRATTSQPKHFSSKPNIEDEMIEEPDLPQIPLPIASLPKFNFKLPSNMTSTPALDREPTTKSIFSQPNAPVTTVSKPTTRCTKTIEQSGAFSFSAPIQPEILPQDLPWQSSSCGVMPKFSFSSPVSLNEVMNNKEETAGGKKNEENFTFGKVAPSITNKSPNKVENKLLKNNLSKSPTISGIQAATELVIGGSVMDILGGKKEIEKKTPIVSDLSEKFKPAPGSWECSTCLVRNSSSDTKCVACETAKPGNPPKSTQFSSSVSTPSVTEYKGFGNKFKPASGSWECSVCMIYNKDGDIKCAACETPKPGLQSQAIQQKPVVPVSTMRFAGFVKPPPSGSWECDTCLVRNNDPTMTKCQACETPRAGSIAVTSNTGFKTSTTFQFGKASNLNNSTAGSTPSFKFGLPISSNVSTTASTTSVSSGFVFGTASTTTIASSPSGFKFGIPSATSTTKSSSDASTNVVKPSFVFGAPKTDAPNNSIVSVTSSSSMSSPLVFGAKTSVTFNKPNVELVFGNDSDKTVMPVNKTENLTIIPENKDTAKSDPAVADSSTLAIPLNVSVAEKTPLPKSSITNATTVLSSSTTSESNSSGFTFGLSKDIVKKPESGNEIGIFGTSNPSKTSISIGNISNNPVSGFGFGSKLSSSDDTTVKLNTKLVAPTELVTSTSTLPTTGLQFTFGNSTPSVDKGKPSETANQYLFKSDIQQNVTKPQQPVTNTITPSLFSFGNNVAVPTRSVAPTPSTSTPGFVFGTALSKPVVGSSATGFNFNSNPSSQISVFGSSIQSTPTVPSLGSSNFAFGNPIPTQKSSLPVTSNLPTNPPNPVFKFGDSSCVTESPSMGNQPPQQTSLFTFGAASNQAPTPSLGSVTRFSANPSFQFGNQPSADSSIFRFGANQANKMPASGLSQASSTTPAMSFGSIGMGTNTSQPPSFGQTTDSGFNFQAGPSAGFTFGNPSAPATLPSSTPQLPFSTTDNPYNGTAGNTSNRKIRKAVRRVNKQSK